MNITIISDLEAVNGVLRTQQALQKSLEEMGHHVTTIMPENFWLKARISDVTLAITTRNALHDRIVASKPDAVHIMTEGSLGFLAAWDAHIHGYPITSSYCSKIHEYAAQRVHPMTEPWVRNYMAWIHNKSTRLLLAHEGLGEEIKDIGIQTPYKVIGRGTFFKPSLKPLFNDLARPISLCAGRVAEEKNLDAFLDMPIPGTRVIVGNGPAMERLQQKYAHDKNVVFTGHKEHAEVADYMTAADFFVFPSKTDTYGRVLLEAQACGLMLVSYDRAAAPMLINNDPRLGACGPDLKAAWDAVYTQWSQIPDIQSEREYRCASASKHTDRAVAEKFVAGLEPIPKVFFLNGPEY